MAAVQGDLEKLTHSSGSAINHVYADTISGVAAVLCWSPTAGVSFGRGSCPKACCGVAAGSETLLVCKWGVLWGGRALGAGGRMM